MDKIPGETLSRLPFRDIHKAADLTYYDGPLLSLFRDATNQAYIFYWCDSDDTCNRWLVFQVSAQQLTGYLSQNMTLHEIITQPQDGQTFVVDIDGQGNHASVVLANPQALPDGYKPRPGTYYDSLSAILAK